MTFAEVINRPATLSERRIQDEYIYNEFYIRYNTHLPADWQDSEWEETRMYSFPPYCYRFDEYFGFILTISIGGSTYFLNRVFPNPDSIDLDYIEDTIFILDQIVDNEKGYDCIKGLGLRIGPSSNARYQANLAEARLWIAIARERLLSKTSYESIIIEEQLPLSHNTEAQSIALSTKLFLNGFNIDKLTRLLIVLEILTESGKHTAASKPRNWRAMVESLRENKLLVYNHNTLLFEFLKSKYSYPYGIRAIQGSFNAKNLDTQDIYNRASAWCIANR